MKQKRLTLVFLSLCLAFQAHCCTTFVLTGRHRVYFGKNLDWSWDEGTVCVNARGVQKKAFLIMGTNAATWTSKFGSVTLNQLGRELPFGGMNEAGLVVEDMWLTDTQYPPADPRPEIDMLQWIQYQLDTCSSVEEVIRTDKQIRLENTPIRARIHYLVCDAKGDCAAVEFLNGAMVVHRGKDLSFRALANDPYGPSATYLKANPKPKEGQDSLPRFCRAAVRAAEFKPGKTPGDDIRYAFDTLEEVRQGTYTAWQVVYDIAAREIHFRTRSNPHLRRVSFKGLDFACKGPPRMVDIQANAGKDGSVEFGQRSETDERRFLERFLSQDNWKQEVGDLTPMLEPLLMTVHSYSCGD